jgi:hypothetical protein
MTLILNGAMRARGNSAIGKSLAHPGGSIGFRVGHSDEREG